MFCASIPKTSPNVPEPSKHVLKSSIISQVLPPKPADSLPRREILCDVVAKLHFQVLLVAASIKTTATPFMHTRAQPYKQRAWWTSCQKCEG